MDQTARDVKSEKSERPEYEHNNRNSSKHRCIYVIEIKSVFPSYPRSEVNNSK